MLHINNMIKKILKIKTTERMCIET